MSGVDAIARAVLYEGFSLYPYRASALKNRRRVLFGTLYPEAWARRAGAGDPWEAGAECLLHDAPPDAGLSISARFLVGDEERRVTIDGVPLAALLGPGVEREVLSARAERLAPDLVRISARVRNVASCADDASRDDVEALALGAAHVVMRASRGSWISVIDPPPDLAEAAASSTQRGLWPVLVGADAMLCAPIILSDHPAVAPESRAGDLFDATEIEEILALRVRTLTDAEKAELSRDPATKGLLERVESLGADDLARLHGVLRRGPQVGDAVTIRPKSRADALDVLLGGMAATVVSIEETIEGEVLVCVTVDADPGKDLGERGFPGHRFFFRPAELEPR